jgi:hypothetical protein
MRKLALPVIVAAAALAPSPALAYLNPDSGSMLLQVLLAGAAGLGVALKLLWHRIAAALGGRAGRESTGNPE